MTTTITKQQIISTKEMKIGDIVSLVREEPVEFDTMIVKNIHEGFVMFYRPYGHFNDVLYTNGVICYVGIEEYEAAINDEKRYILHRRTALR